MTKQHDQLKMQVAERDNFTCQCCLRYIGLNGCLADRISQGKTNRKKYGNDVIDHPFNKVYTCISTCNDFFNIGFKKLKSERLVNLIKERGDEKLSSNEISRIIYE